MGEPRFITSFEEIGWAEGQRDLLLRQLNRKVGPLAAELQARVVAFAPEAAPGARAASEQPQARTPRRWWRMLPSSALRRCAS